MTETSRGHLLNLDVAAGIRQAIGVQFERSEKTPERLRLLKRGEIILPPHPLWKGDPTDWMADPYKDRNWKFQFHTLRWINPLVWSALDGDENSRQEWLRIVRSWHEANVPASKAVSPFAWKDMGDGNRAVQICIGASLPGANDQWFVQLLEAHRDWLMDDGNIVFGNHALHQNIGLFVVGAVLRDGTAMKVARDRMLAQFLSAFDDEGVNEEGSVVYHQLNISWWVGAAERLAMEEMDFPDEVTARLGVAANTLAHLVLPNGQLTQIGDGSRGRVRRGINENCDFVATGGEVGKPPGDLVRHFKQGYYTSRSGWGAVQPLWDESHLVLRHGGRMLGHAHEDRGSVHLYSKGTAWLVDSGFHSYQKRDPIRNYLKSRAAHNVASLTDEEYVSPTDVPLTTSKVTEDFHYVEVEDYGYDMNTLRRRVVYLKEPDCWLVFDQNKGASEGSIRQSWHVNSGIHCSRHDRGFELRDSKSRLTMSWLGRLPNLRLHRAVDGDLRGWIGTRWKTLEPGALITSDAPAGGIGLVTLIAPAGELHSRLGVVHSYVTTAGVLYAVLVRGNKAWTVTVMSQEVEVVSHQ